MKNGLFVLVAILCFVACQKPATDPNPVTPTPVPLSSEKAISKVVFKSADNSSLPTDIIGTILSDTIKFNFPDNIALTALVPTIEFSGKSVTPANKTPQDFTKAVTYTVTAEDGTQKKYIVSTSILKTDTQNISPVVYIAGDSFDLSTRYLPYPVYWKNNKLNLLPDNGYSSGTGIAVSDKDVYVSSSGVYSGNNVTYWKNGVGIDLSDPTIIYPTATAITLSGNDVYVAGGAYINSFEKFVPVYWKNRDKAVKISTFSSDRGEARAIAVSGNDIYLAGSTYDQTLGYGSPACYWKNGTPLFLHSNTNSSSSNNGIAKSICVSGSDVYVVGDVYFVGSASDQGTATYWRNGTAVELTPNQISTANSITVVGDDVYIAGAIMGPDRLPRATYWKNGVAVPLESTYSVANAIAVFENDIYVAGNRGVDTALYWKNGKPIILGRGRANSIVVKK
jgi:hypothetical protein